jgi:hypothetical protein
MAAPQETSSKRSLNAWRTASARQPDARGIDDRLAGGRLRTPMSSPSGAHLLRRVSNRARIILGDGQSHGRSAIPVLRLRLRGGLARKSINPPGLPLAAWSIFRHSQSFSATRSCLDSNTRSILRQSFETRMSPKADRTIPLATPPLSESLPARSPTALGLTRSLPQSHFAKIAYFTGFSRESPASGPVTPKAHHQKSHTFSPAAPCLLIKQLFEFQSSV